jgi:hypothetical protein
MTAFARYGTKEDGWQRSRFAMMEIFNTQSFKKTPSITFTTESTMTPRSSTLKTIAKTIERPNTDFTAEGSPLPGTTETSVQLRVSPADKSTHARRRPTLGLPKQSAPKLPHERDESIDSAGTVPSEPMKQASRDITRGLTDTDRGAAVGRTYKKLKQTP